MKLYELNKHDIFKMAGDSKEKEWIFLGMDGLFGKITVENPPKEWAFLNIHASTEVIKLKEL